MKKRIVVLSLGGSLIVPEKIDLKFLEEFKKVLNKNKKNYKFIIVCGGGIIARLYINALRESKKDNKVQSLVGIAATRINARFVSYFLGLNSDKDIPQKIRDVKKRLKKEGIAVCGALEYQPNQTSDSTAAEIAERFNAEFINLTNVNGLYDKNPKKYKDAKFIPEISFGEFHKLATATKFQPGQHFVLDHTASEIILKNKIPTYIIKSMKQLDNLLNGRKFIGTTVKG